MLPVALLGSCPLLVKRGGLEVWQRFPAHKREGETTLLLRENSSILLVPVAILMASPKLDKNPLLLVKNPCTCLIVRDPSRINPCKSQQSTTVRGIFGIRVIIPNIDDRNAPPMSVLLQPRRFSRRSRCLRGGDGKRWAGLYAGCWRK